MNLISHRGLDNHKYLENTKEALFEALSKNYICGVELDVRLTKDNRFVIYHNSSFLCRGIRKFIKNCNYNDIISNALGNINKPKYIDGLEDFLNCIKTDKLILLEIKYEGKNYKKIVKAMNKILKKYKNLNIWCCSFNYNLVNEMTSKSKTKVGLIISDIVNKTKDIKKFDFVSLSKNAFNDIKTYKIKMVWTINKKNMLNKVITSDYIITDKAYLFV